MMLTYKNLSGKSGVLSYDFKDDAIEVEFPEGIYLYNNEITGAKNVEQMKSLATQGHGLNSFINRHVRNLYAAVR